MIAANIFGSTGIVLEIENDHYSATPFLDCNYWSSFPNEDERFFIGGLQSFYFLSIRDIPLGKNYRSFIKTIRILYDILSGWPLENIQIFNSDTRRISLLIEAELNGYYLDSSLSRIPNYVLSLFHQFIINRDKVNINLYNMDKELLEDEDNMKYYGYNKARHIFLCDDENTINFSKLVPLFTNLKTFNVFSPSLNADGDYEKSIKLNQSFTDEIIKCVELLNKIRNYQYPKFQIVNPSDSIQEFIKKNEKIFNEKGWNVETSIYYNSHRPENPCKNTLCINKKK